MRCGARAPVCSAPPFISIRLCRMMTRRTFLHHAAMASAAGSLPFQQRQTYKMGLQLVHHARGDVEGPRRHDGRIADLGYEEVETYGFDPQGIGYYGMPASVRATVAGQQPDDPERTLRSEQVRDDERGRSETVWTAASKEQMHRRLASPGRSSIRSHELSKVSGPSPAD